MTEKKIKMNPKLKAECENPYNTLWYKHQGSLGNVVVGALVIFYVVGMIRCLYG